MRITEADGHDAGATVVLVHGPGHTARVWGTVQDALHHRSVAIDLPGRADNR